MLETGPILLKMIGSIGELIKDGNTLPDSLKTN